jgi:hypothetical protein
MEAGYLIPAMSLGLYIIFCGKFSLVLRVEFHLNKLVLKHGYAMVPDTFLSGLLRC